MRKNVFNPVLLASLAASASSQAGIVTFLDDQEGWAAAAGGLTSSVDFVPPDGVPQLVSGLFYKDLGITLSGWWTEEPVNWLLQDSPVATDGFQGSLNWLSGSPLGAINFDKPIRAFAMDKYVTFLAIVHFYMDGSLVGTSEIETGDLHQNHFFGWKTDFDFDRIVFGSGSSAIDNIYFSTIPAPGGAALLGLAGVLGAFTRRRSVES